MTKDKRVPMKNFILQYIFIAFLSFSFAFSNSAIIHGVTYSTFSQNQKLVASDAASNNRYGQSVAIQDNLLIVSAKKNWSTWICICSQS